MNTLLFFLLFHYPAEGFLRPRAVRFSFLVSRLITYLLPHRTADGLQVTFCPDQPDQAERKHENTLTARTQPRGSRGSGTASPLREATDRPLNSNYYFALNSNHRFAAQFSMIFASIRPIGILSSPKIRKLKIFLHFFEAALVVR